MRKVAGTMLILGIACAPVLGFAGESSADAAKPADTNTCCEKIPLFNGKDFTGWKLFIPETNVDPATVWSVRDGVVHCGGSPSGYMRTTKKYENYRLTFEWRWPEEGGNSGLLMHITGEDAVWPKSIEGQLHAGDAADFWVIGGTDFKEHTDKSTRRVVKMKPSNEKPLGEWNKYEAICVGNVIHMIINGELQNLATDTTVAKGYIGLQSEGAPIEFRNIMMEPTPQNPHKTGCGKEPRKEGS